MFSSLVAKLAGQPAAQHNNCERGIKFYLAAMATPEDVVLQFRAGLMKAENNTLKADQRKGLVRLSQVLRRNTVMSLTGRTGYGLHPDLSCIWFLLQAEDGLLHFRWYERVGTSETKGSAQHDTIVFPGEATFTKVQLQDSSFEDCFQ